jgi:glycosyltransferase involved in cell wall biosynthesis
MGLHDPQTNRNLLAPVVVAMKALFLTKYDRRGASSRYRALQYIPYLVAQGWQVQIEPLLSDDYIRKLYSDGTRSGIHVGNSLWRRFRYLLSGDLDSFDVIYVQYEMLPYCPFPAEAIFYRRGRVVVDYDDATFLLYTDNPFLRQKIAKVMGASQTVCVGNEYLRAYAVRHNAQVSVIPTVVDMDRYRPKDSYEFRPPRPVIGWMGTPLTASHLASSARALEMLAQDTPFLLRCVGTPPDFQIPGVAVENLPWSEETETQWIRSFDLGVMPLPDEPFTMGKCGFKLIQYMGCGVPAVGTARGANMEIIQDGANGLLAASDEELASKLRHLIGSAELRARLGRAGRRTVEQRYSLQVTASRFCDLLKQTASRENAVIPHATHQYCAGARR